MGDGYLFIDIHEPVSCFSSNADDYIFTSYISPETPNEIIDLEAMDGSGEINAQASSYNVVAADCYLGTYGFYIGKEPFQFVATPSDSYYGSDFLEFLKDVLNSCLEYASCPILNNLGRESNGHLAQLF